MWAPCRYFASRDLQVAATFGRKFYWWGAAADVARVC
jgi:hypothetical protein